MTVLNHRTEILLMFDRLDYVCQAELIEKMYGQYYSPATVSNITKQTASLVEEFHTRKFKQSQYVCVFLDATYIPLRRGTVEREAVNIVIGIRSDGTKEVLDYCIASEGPFLHKIIDTP